MLCSRLRVPHHCSRWPPALDLLFGDTDAFGELALGKPGGDGTCGGFQHVVIEYARHVLGFEDAWHAEYDPYASELFISQLTCSLVGQTARMPRRAHSAIVSSYPRRLERVDLL